MTSLLVASTSTNEIANRNVATAAASAKRNCDVRLKMNTGAVCVCPIRFPDTKITLPISPRHRENVSSVPAITADRIAGNTTRRKVAKRVAPRVAAASSSATPAATPVADAEAPAGGQRRGWTMFMEAPITSAPQAQFGPTGVAPTPEPAPAVEPPYAAGAAGLLVLFGAVAFVAGAALVMWPMWAAGIALVAGALLVHRP